MLNDLLPKSQRYIYPNPAIEKVMFKREIKGQVYSIIDLFGRVVKCGIYESEIDLRGLPAGTYIVKYYGESYKMIKLDQY